jgi:hypothetical protein
MALSEILGKTAAALSAVAVSMVFAVAGAVPAAADPGICVSGPWGYASACVKRARMGRLGPSLGRRGGKTAGATVTTKVKTTSVA